MTEPTAPELTPETLQKQISDESVDTYTSVPLSLLDGLSKRVLYLRNRLRRQGQMPAPPNREALGRYATFSTILVGLLVLLIGFLTAWLAGEFTPAMLPKISLTNQEAFRASIASLQAFAAPWWIHLWAIATGCLALRGSRAMYARFLDVFPNKPVKAMPSTPDLLDLRNWLMENSRPNFYLWVAIPGGLLLGLFLALVWQYQKGQAALNVSLVVVAVLSSMLASLALSYIYPYYLVFPAKLSRYRFDLFNNDPSNSEVIKDLAGLYTYIMLITMGILAFFTVGLYSFGFLTGSTLLFLVVFIWGPTIYFFFVSQTNINKIIVTNKWATLNALQQQIEAMYDLRKINAEDVNAVPKKEDLERLDKLVGLYERVSGYSNTSLNVQGIISIVTILLLPLITLVLDYLDPIKEFLNRITQGGG